MNAIRSPMAEAIARHLFGNRIYIASAGVRQGEADPFAVKVMEEIGLDIGKHRPHTFEDLEDSNFDLVVTLAPEAHHKALDMTRIYDIDVEYWPIPDPALASGSREQIMDSYRSVRDMLTKRIKQRLDWTSHTNE
ncbi:MAG: arsenate reductase ArsC [Hyphomicrobiaceae bacterium]|nr:arsenate reductase ArsC [Hyphomicrobiaceae bacterium]